MIAAVGRPLRENLKKWRMVADRKMEGLFRRRTLERFYYMTLTICILMKKISKMFLALYR